MSTLVRFSPFREAARLQQDFDRLFGGTPETLQNWAPPVDIYEDAEGITLSAELPGFAPNDIDLRVENGTLTLKGERKLDKEDKRDNYRRVERFHGAFTRSFSLPPTVDTEKVRAESKNGVLHVFLPRREDTKPKQIKVKIEA